MYTSHHQDLLVRKIHRSPPIKKKNEQEIKELHLPVKTLTVQETKGLKRHSYGAWVTSAFIAVLAIPTSLQMAKHMNHKESVPAIHRAPQDLKLIQPLQKYENETLPMPWTPSRPIGADPLGQHLRNQIVIIHHRAAEINLSVR